MAHAVKSLWCAGFSIELLGAGQNGDMTTKGQIDLEIVASQIFRIERILLFEYVLSMLFFFCLCISPFWRAPETERKMENTKNNTVGARIREMRKAAGLSQEQLAEIICTKKSTISDYENDKIDIKSSILLELSEVLHCSCDYLLKAYDEMQKYQKLIAVFEGLGSDALKAIALKQIATLQELNS